MAADEGFVDGQGFLVFGDRFSELLVVLKLFGFFSIASISGLMLIAGLLVFLSLTRIFENLLGYMIIAEC